jgi:glycosyltransferase involved in cell wall biosynthesis
MSTDIKFSVTVPAYKAQFLAECIDSILVQTYKNFELIIVNDASPQDLDSIVSKYDDPRIRYYKNEVGFGAEHVVGNWNKCLEYATGDYIICMGDDDKLLPNCLEGYVKLIEKYPGLNVYHALTEIIDENSNFSSIQEMRPEREGVYSMIYGRLFGNRLQYIGDWLFLTNWLRSNGGYVNIPLAWGSDDLTAYYASIGNGVANSQFPMFQYRVNSQTISHNGNTREKLRSMIETFQQIKIILSRKCEDELDKKYKLSCLKKFEKKVKVSKSFAIQQDMVSCGKLTGLFWWLRHADKINLPKTEILKAFIKALNK